MSSISLTRGDGKAGAPCCPIEALQESFANLHCADPKIQVYALLASDDLASTVKNDDSMSVGQLLVCLIYILSAARAPERAFSLRQASNLPAEDA